MGTRDARSDLSSTQSLATQADNGVVVDLREGVAPPLQTQSESASPLGQVVKVAVLFVLAGVTTYLILTGPSYWTRVAYWLDHRGQPNEAEIYVDVNAPAQSFSGAVGAALRQPSFLKPDVPVDTTGAPIVEGSGATITLEDNTLLIPKLNLRTPIVWNSSSEEKIMLANLQQGVAHYGFTSLPNAESGNIFITGHSSFYWWDKGKYKTVFALLDKLTPGDQALLRFEGKIYVYTLRDERVVKPSDVSVTDQTEEPILSLMTCTPIGTSLNRLVSRFDLAKVYTADGSEPAATPAPAASTESFDPLPPEQTAPMRRDTIWLVPGLR